MKNPLESRIKRQEQYILALEQRLKEAGSIASRTIQLERDLGIALSAIAELKHKLFLIGTEEEIQEAIANHSAGIFLKTPMPKIGIKKPKHKQRRKR